MNKKDLIIIIGITLMALLFRVYGMLNFGDLWIDELFSYYFANQDGVTDIVKTLFMEDFHGPLYFILLHYWIKLFGSTDFIIRLMGCICSVGIIPVAFYIAKSLFNRTAAYFAVIFFAISAFHIHYSVEVRFYGMAMLFSLLSSYFFVLLFEFKRRNIIFYIISTILLLYTFNISFIFVFCQFLTGLVYLIYKNRPKIWAFIKIFLIIGVLYLPMIIMIVHSVLLYKNALLSFYRDIFAFDLLFFYTWLLSLYSNIYDQFITNDLFMNQHYIKMLFNPIGIIFMLTPVLIGLACFVRAIRTSDKKIFLFLIPSVLFFISTVVLVLTHQMALVSRYLGITYPIIICFTLYGLSLLRSKKLKLTIFVSWILINLSVYIFYPNNVLNRNNYYAGNLKEVLAENVTSSDYIFIPRFGKILDRYVTNGSRIDFDTYDALMLGIRKDVIVAVFGEELSSILNRKMAKTYLYNYISTDIASGYLENYIQKNYFSKMEKGQKFVIVTDEMSYINNWGFIASKLQNLEIYKRSAIYYPLSSKIAIDVIRTAYRNLHFVKIIPINEYFSVFVFEKTN